MTRKQNVKKSSNERAGRQKEKTLRFSAAKEETKNLLSGFHKVLLAMSACSRAGLTKVSMGFRNMGPQGLKQTRSEMKQIRTAIKQMRADVFQMKGSFSRMLDGFNQYQAETAAAWKDLVATMHAVSEGVPTEKSKEGASEEGKYGMYNIDLPPMNGGD